jgi:hypothetical protein
VVHCSACGREFDRTGFDTPVAVIALDVAGDEHIESFFFCEPCGVYTQELFCDRFLGEDSVLISGPISKSAGDALVARIRQCPDPLDKRCSCEVHREFL